MKNATIHDIARKAGVSAMTVSRALRQSPVALQCVSEPTRRKVLGAVQSMNYRIHPAALLAEDTGGAETACHILHPRLVERGSVTTCFV